MRRVKVTSRVLIRRRWVRSKWAVKRFWKRNGDVAFHDRRFAKRALEALEGRRFDICLAHDVLSLAAGRRLARRDGARLLVDVVEIPRVASRVGTFFRNQPRWVRWYMDLSHRRGIRAADRLIAIGPSLARWTEARFRLDGPVAVVRNLPVYATTPSGSTIKHDLGLSADERLALYLNTAAPGFGVEQLMDAVGMMPAHVHAALLGPVTGVVDGARRRPYLDWLQERARERGVAPRFHFLGVRPADEFVAYASGADMGVITTLPGDLNVKLSLPNRIFSHISAGLPVACTDIPDISEIVEHYRIGRTFHADDPETIARTIMEMLDGGELHTMRANAARAAEELCWEREVERLRAIFREEDRGQRRVCVLARKNLTVNDRIRRIARTLVDDGFEVTVVGGEVPPPESRYRVPNVQYIAVGIAGARPVGAP